MKLLLQISSWLKNKYLVAVCVFAAIILFFTMTLLSFQYGITGDEKVQKDYGEKVLDFFKPQKTKNPLSPKESEVLSQLSEGLSYKMIADKIGVSYNTVNGHVKNIYQKLHVASLGEAIAYYYKHLKM